MNQDAPGRAERLGGEPICPRLRIAKRSVSLEGSGEPRPCGETGLTS